MHCGSFFAVSIVLFIVKTDLGGFFFCLLNQMDMHIFQQQSPVQYLWADDPNQRRPYAFHIWTGSLQQQWGEWG